ncbi:unnamed protein product [Acanthoscelides obtectus]|uniref:Uncharacterized protein n=1 Tax=Acanthoscelides obtectus TaxID=200917 RepID=A0A9P0LWE4_ACAOB|nr:unnamed protein product [Acanthoscelides obtectus]CAK1634024.1 hypothetical protein AOBTE_LOCUS8544 [Acanthoscelides obtectus]
MLYNGNPRMANFFCKV